MKTQERIPEDQLTRYVMGELPEAEQKALEAVMAKDPALAREVETLRGFCGLLWTELKKEPMPRLKPEQLASLRQDLEQGASSSPPRKSRKIWLAGIPLLAAAAAAFFLVKPQILSKSPGAHGDAEEVRFVASAPELPKDEKASAGKREAESVVGKEVVQEKKKLALAEVRRDQPTAASSPLKSGGPGKSMAGAVAQNRAPAGATGAAPYGALADSRSRRLIPKPEMKKSDHYAAEFDDAEANGADLGMNTEAYDAIVDNPFRATAQDPLSTFSVDVDTASYANVRRFLEGGQTPPKDAVRIEELLNYFRYDYKAPTDRPFGVEVEVGEAPWKPEHRLVRIGIKGKEGAFEARKDSNLVFLVDVSGSMNGPLRLPLVKQSLRMLVDKLDANDRIALVVYAGTSGLVLPSTSAREKATILDAIERLEAGGSTNGGEGIQLAYKTARQSFVKGGINRVVLASDGDFNVGISNQGDLVRLITKEAKDGIFLSVLGFGIGNLKDSTMEKLADKGNGNYAYIDSLAEAKKVLVEEAGGTLVTIAKDVKLQLEFNPEAVQAFRLIGYENRVLAHEDFNDDAKDAGDIGSGHTVTALYEVVPKGVAFTPRGVDAMKYQKPAAATGAHDGELVTVKLRYKEPEGSKSSLIEYAVKDKGRKLADATADYKFAASVAGFGMLLRDSEYKGAATWDQVMRLATEGAKDTPAALGPEQRAYREGFLELIKKARKAAPSP